MINTVFVRLPVLLFFIYAATCILQQGDECTFAQTDTIGVCMKIFDCPYTSHILNSSKRPEYCQQVDNLVCCPQRKSEIECLNYHEQKEGLGSPVFAGKRPMPKEFPHMAALGYGDKEDIAWQCGGSLISDEFVLTAAHCTFSRDEGPVRWVRLGDIYLANTTDDTKSQNFTVSQIIVHPEYKPPLKYNDIALLKLDRKAKIDDYVKPACLHTKRSVPNRLTAIGWGTAKPGGTASNRLLKVDLDVVDHNICKARYKPVRTLNKGILDEMQICAGHQDGRDTCYGDSGGPLQFRVAGNPSYYRIVGITSFGIGCGSPKNPGVYVKVSNYIRWIENNVWSEYVVWS